MIMGAAARRSGATATYRSTTEDCRVEMRSLGASGQRISVLGYGAWVTGADTASTSLDAADVEGCIRTALDAGITWIDTAEIYANGGSEEVVGRAIREVRDDVVLVTKVAPSGAGSGMRPDDLTHAIAGSLRRLGTDRVDLYLLHWNDPSVPVEETWGGMADLVGQGLVRWVGVSNFGDELIRRCLAVAPVHAVENQLSLLHRDDEGLAARLSAQGIAYLAYGALGFGLLSRRVTPATALDPSDWRAGRFARHESNYYEELFAPGRIDRSHAFALALSAIADSTGVSAPVLALRWVIERPGVTAAVVGSTNVEHLRTNALAGTLRLDAATAARIEELLRRDRGTAGEAEPWKTPSASTHD
jgi:aryl-alcohol dehydrogenase-like predicted oxidoreductase